MSIAAPSTLPATPERPATRFKLGKLDRPAGYGAALSLVGVALVVVPAIFIAVLALFTWMCAWHLYESIAWLQEGPYFLFHLPMALIGLLLLVMLIKPIFFHKKASDAGVVTITAEQQPRLFAFVAELCDAAGAPRPKVIEVDCEANAAVSIIHGWRGVRRRDLSLRIGLPLVVSMPLDQFAGVLAHEFGHFNQRSGLSGTVLVRAFMAFLARIVFARDKLDAMLRKLRFRGALAVIYFVCALMIESARGVLWLMLMICEVLTCRLMREMEHDADQLEAQLAGSETFVKTSEWMNLIGFASQQAHAALAEQWEQRRLADNLPRLIAAKAVELEDRRGELMKLLDETPTRWFHTHPSHKERVAYVRSLNLAGEFSPSEPAETLFDDVDGLCRTATDKAYRQRVGAQLDKTTLAPTGPMIRELAEQTQANRSLARFFRGTVCSVAPIFPIEQADPPADDFELAVAELRSAREALLACGEGAEISARQFTRSVQDFDARAAEVMLFEFFKFRPKAASAAKRTRKQMQKIEITRNKADQTLKPFEDASRRRLIAAVRVGLSAQMTQRLPGDGEKTQGWIRYWVGIALFLQDALPHIQILRRSATRINVMMQGYNPARPFPMVTKTILDDIAAIRQAITEVKKLTGYQPFPFEHGRGKVMIDEALFEEMPKEKEADVAYRVAWGALERYTSFTFRSLARLTELAEKVEHAAGLDPLPDPQKVIDPQAAIDAKLRAKQEKKYWFAFGSRAASGTTLLALLAWFSFFPPDLPAMGWGGNGGPSPMAYRPASFASVSTSYWQPPAPSHNPGAFGGPAGPSPYSGPTVLYANPGGVQTAGGYQPYVQVPVVAQPGYGTNPMMHMQPGYQPPNGGPYNPNNPSNPQGRSGYTPPRQPSFGAPPSGFGGGSRGGGGGNGMGGGGGGHR